jgi:hypothetical protein
MTFIIDISKLELNVSKFKQIGISSNNATTLPRYNTAVQTDTLTSFTTWCEVIHLTVRKRSLMGKLKISRGFYPSHLNTE